MKMEFAYNSERIPEGIRILQKKIGLYLFWNDEYANSVYARLRQWNIAIEGVIVRDECYKKKMEFHEWKVETFGKIRGRKINIIVGYNILEYEDLNRILVDSEEVDQIYYLDGQEIFSHDMKFRKDINLLDDYYRILLPRNLDYAYFKDNYEEFVQTYNWLEDEKSRLTMECYLNLNYSR